MHLLKAICRNFEIIGFFQSVFSMMVNQLKGLENTKSNLSTKYFYLLEVCCLDDKNTGLISCIYNSEEMLHLINPCFIITF